MFLIDTQHKMATALDKVTFSSLGLTEVDDLQEWIVNNTQILGEDLLIIQKEFAGFSDTNERLDLLALDEEGRLVVIENKLDDSGRDVVWQATKYASYCAMLSKNQIVEVYQSYLGSAGSAEEGIADFYGQDFEEIRLNQDENSQRIIIVSANFRKEVTSAVLWLRSYGVDISCIKITPHRIGEKLFLDVERIIPLQDILDYQITLKKGENAEFVRQEAARHKLRRAFWEQALPVLRERTSIFMNVSPQIASWINGGSGLGGITYAVVIAKDSARAELFIGTADKDRNKQVFDTLLAQKDEIEQAFGGALDWQRLDNKKGSRIAVHYGGYGLHDREHWDEVIDFMADSIARLVGAFKPILNTLR